MSSIDIKKMWEILLSLEYYLYRDLKATQYTAAMHAVFEILRECQTTST